MDMFLVQKKAGTAFMKFQKWQIKRCIKAKNVFTAKADWIGEDNIAKMGLSH